MRILIKNGNIVNEGLSYKGSLLINGKRIEKIYRASEPEYLLNVANCEKSLLSATDEVIDAENLTILPGVIDDQVHFREPGGEQKATIESESRAAVLGGVTSFMDMPNNNPPATTIGQLEQKYKIAQESSWANYSFYLGATNSNIDEILQADKEQICGIKLFMGSSTGNMLVDSPVALDNIFSKAEMLIATHCEQESIINSNLDSYKKRYGEQIPFWAHPQIRSREACIECTKRAIEYALKYNSRLHVLHISTAEEIEMIREARKKNSKITGEICVHYLWFSSDDYTKYGSKIKCNPAIKEPKDREALRQAIKEKIISVVATDHAPHLREEKCRGYLQAPSGLPTIQHSLQIMVELAKKGIFTIEEVAEVMSHGPSRSYDIKERGAIREGYMADLAIIDLNKEYTVSKENIAYKCNWSPFEGYTFGSSVIYTIINGVIVVKNGEITGRRCSERLLFCR